MKKTECKVLEAKKIAEGIYEMLLETDLGESAKPGQFLNLYMKDASHILPRPISICEYEQDKIRLVYRVAGEGTRYFATLQSGDTLEVLGNIGNGFPLEKGEGKRALLIGGGIGVPPILGLAKSRFINGEGKENNRIVVGYRNDDLFLKEDFERYGEVEIATEDGSVGTKGNVLTAIRERGIEADIIYACGPMPMLRAIKEYAIEKGIPAYISLEERMACGVGACLGCVCKTVKKDAHSNNFNARVCTEGPVFEAREVEI